MGRLMHLSHCAGAAHRTEGTEPANRTRPAIANERLKRDGSGDVVLQLKSAWRDGTTHIVMSPLELMQRLAALVPRSRSRRGSTRSASRSLSPTARTPRCSRRHRRSLRCARAHRDDPGTECARGLRCSRRGLRGPHHRGPAPLESHHRPRPHDRVRPDHDGLTQPARRDGAAARQRNPEGADPHQSAGARGALRALRSIPPECRVVKGWAAV